MPKIIPVDKLEDIRNKTISIDANSTDEQYPSAKAVYDALGNNGGGSNPNAVGQKTADGGEIFNDYENNKAIGEGTSARGLNTQAGTLARKIVADGIKVLKADDNSDYYQITVSGLVNSDELCIDTWVATDNYIAGTSDLLTIDCKTHLSNALYISNIEEDANTNTTTITVKRVDNRNFTAPSMDNISGTDMEEDWVYVPGKLNGQISPQFTSAFVGGKDSVATGFAAVSFGRANVSAGNYSITLGRGNKASYAGVAAGVYNEAGNGGIALGNSNRALGDAAVATGTNTYARAASSRAGGRQSEALSEFTVAEGLGVRAGLKQGQVVHGKYNVRSDSHLFIIGDGSADNNRHDAFAITEDYKVLLNGGKVELADTKRVDNILYGSKTLNDTNNEASGTMALATGGSTTASGNYSFAGGVGSKATARSAIAVGEKNYATQQGAFASGINAEANGFGTVALGYGVKTINAASVYGQMAVGKYNLPNAYSLFMVGNGTSKDDRKNTFEVRNDGSAYLETQGNENNSVVIKSGLNKFIHTYQKTEIRTVESGTLDDFVLEGGKGRYYLEFKVNNAQTTDYYRAELLPTENGFWCGSVYTEFGYLGIYERGEIDGIKLTATIPNAPQAVSTSAKIVMYSLA